MPLNKAKGNMYGFITHTWNPIKGICYHGCSYCYMRKWWPQMKEQELRPDELKTNLGAGNYIFVGSGIDMFSQNVESYWIQQVLEYCKKFDNTYLFQTKNPHRFQDFKYRFPTKSILCTTLETNRRYPELMIKSQSPYSRMYYMKELTGVKKMITIEPVIDFDTKDFVRWIKEIDPNQINIGADSGRNNLPKPPPNELKKFIFALKMAGLNVHLKKI